MRATILPIISLSLIVLSLCLGSCVGGKTTSPKGSNAPTAAASSRPKPNGVNCRSDEECKSGRCAEPEGSLGTPAHCMAAPRSLPAAATCFFGEECKSGSCAGPGCTVGMPGRCVSSRGGCRGVTQFCTCDGYTGNLSKQVIDRKYKQRCPWTRYQHLGACKVEPPQNPEAYFQQPMCYAIVDGRFTTEPCPFVEPEPRDTGEVWTHEEPAPAQPVP